MIRAALSVLAGGVAAVLVAIVVAIADLFLVGHGQRSLLAPVIEFEPMGVVLGLGDIAMLAAAGAAAAGAWYLLGRGDMP